jgi:hypothetical protein
VTLAPRLSLAPKPHDGQSTIAALETRGDQEFADVRLTMADRRFVRRLLTLAERRLSDEALMHLAGGAENAAWRKRAEEPRGG